jgi:RNA polymerase sigma factor (sigma-70 family)
MHIAPVAVGQRSTLVVRHLPLVKALTTRARRRLPTTFEAEDLFGAGAIGLVEASRAFNPACGATFGQFAQTVIQRAMADHVRSGTAANRQHRRDTRAGRTPIDTKEVPVTAAAHVPAAGDSPEDVCIAAERSALLQAAIDALPTTSRGIIERFYYRGSKASSLNLTGTRLFKQHQRALTQLRDEMKRRGLSAECFI